MRTSNDAGTTGVESADDETRHTITLSLSDSHHSDARHGLGLSGELQAACNRLVQAAQGHEDTHTNTVTVTVIHG